MKIMDERSLRSHGIKRLNLNLNIWFMQLILHRITIIRSMGKMAIIHLV